MRAFATAASILCLGLALAACPPQGSSEGAAPGPTAAPAAPAAQPPTASAAAGSPLGDAELVDVSALLASPDAYQGKRVRVKGKVRSMCHHRRNWFAVEADAAPDSYLRVITEPAFLVPQDAIGKVATTEGTVEVTEISAGTARHYADDHQLGKAPAAEAPIKQIVLRATGAEFI